MRASILLCAVSVACTEYKLNAEQDEPVGGTPSDPTLPESAETGGITGRLCDPSSGDWLAAADVWIDHDLGTSRDVTDLEGYFLLTGVAPGPQTLEVALGEYADSVSVEIPIEASAELYQACEPDDPDTEPDPDVTVPEETVPEDTEADDTPEDEADVPPEDEADTEPDLPEDTGAESDTTVDDEPDPTEETEPDPTVEEEDPEPTIDTGTPVDVCPGVDASSILADGGFEAAYCSGSWSFYSAGSTGLTDWSIDTGSIDVVSSTYAVGAEGDQWLDLNGSGPGVVSQTVATKPGATYTLTFCYAGNPAYADGVKSVEVQWDGGVVGEYSHDVSTSSMTDMGWTVYTISLAATGTTSELTFASTTATSACGPAFDAVSLVED
jgi:choice-of-anchor C domain-containing protein